MKSYVLLRTRAGLLSLCIIAILQACSEDAGRAENHRQKIDIKSTSEDKAAFENDSGLTLPVNAKILNYEKESGLDVFYRAKLQLTMSDFAVWIDQLMLKKENFSDAKRYLLGQNTSWWRPQGKDPLPTTQVLFENTMTLNLGYSRVNKKGVIVWLVYHGR